MTRRLQEKENKEGSVQDLKGRTRSLREVRGFAESEQAIF
jgi:hypothetical protein